MRYVPPAKRPGRPEGTTERLRRMVSMEEARERPFDPEAPREHYAGSHHFAVNVRNVEDRRPGTQRFMVVVREGARRVLASPDSFGFMSLEEGRAWGEHNLGKRAAFEILHYVKGGDSDPRMGAFEQGGAFAANGHTASWVIRNKTSGEVIMETYDPKKVAALNTQKYEAVPIVEYLADLNRQLSSFERNANEDVATVEAKAAEFAMFAEHPSLRDFEREDYRRRAESLREYARAVRGHRAVDAGFEPNGFPKSEADRHAATELVMFIENTSDLAVDGPRGQGRSVLLNALRKWRKGTYDPALAVRLFEYLAETGAKRYAHEAGSSKQWSQMFNAATRRQAARDMEETFRSAAGKGEYDDVDTRIGQ